MRLVSLTINSSRTNLTAEANAFKAKQFLSFEIYLTMGICWWKGDDWIV